MNAEAKKKVDVLSEELLPYIIAEQERRTTLHKRVMTAIQNGEKGVTVAEIRNKPPLIIRKANRAPKEPDGSGVLGCEDDITPTQIMYDSCLKRTSLNYTTSKCTLEDTDDVVVHYRYYPDRAKNTNQSIEIDMENPKPQDFGDYFAIFQNGDGQEERVKILTVRYIVIKISRFDASYEVGEHYDTTISYQCDSCDLTDILCNGESVLAAGRVSIVSVYKHQQQLLTEIKQRATGQRLRKAEEQMRDETTAEGGGEATTAGGEGEETTAQALAAEGTEVTESGITVAADVAVTQAGEEPAGETTAAA
ncbi:hypothetical protein MSG28_015931 [Choristoneura fumiferana]|uniref:Uncharacterized protein n=1 Tax=Choristoneura fumiferana TaxID=7141 RepID=A0ACC0K4M7_CHOFU|nr:hypothetical protein MSG28_015931 [Choristoneura fumiferana]